jgi:hypothetical protein
MDSSAKINSSSFKAPRSTWKARLLLMYVIVSRTSRALIHQFYTWNVTENEPNPEAGKMRTL